MKYQAFTLLELLIFITISSLVLLVFSGFLFTVNRTNTALGTNQTIDRGGEQMRILLRNTLSSATEIVSPNPGDNDQELTFLNQDKEERILTAEVDSDTSNTHLILKNPATGQDRRINPQNTDVKNFTITHRQHQRTANLHKADITLDISFTLAFDQPNVSNDLFEYSYDRDFDLTIPLNKTLTVLPYTENLDIWLRSDANLEINSDTQVETWSDSWNNTDFETPSTSGNFTESPLLTPYQKNNTARVQFNNYNGGVRSWLENTSYPIPEEHTIIILTDSLFQPNSALNQTLLSNQTNKDVYQLQVTSNNELTLNIDGNTISVPGFSRYQQMISSVHYTNDIHRLYLNNSLEETVYNQSFPTNVGNNLYLGCEVDNNNEGSDCLQGNIAEVLIYNTALKPSQIQDIYQYLNSKYQLQNSQN